MKYLKTYEGLFSFLKKKPKQQVKSKDFVISDDMFYTISDIIGDADLMGLRVHTVMTDSKGKVYSVIDRGDGSNRNTGLGGAPIRKHYNTLKEYDINEMCYILTRLVDYVRSESENKLDVRIDFIDNGPHSQGGDRITNPTEASIHNQLSEFYGNLAYDWRSLQISIVSSK